MGAAGVRNAVCVACWPRCAAAAGSMPEASAQPAEPELAQRQASFSIPPQPLADAITSFGRQSGMQVSVDGDLARGIASPGVSGSMTPEQALSRLLAGTGITYRMTGGNAALLVRVSDSQGGALQLDPVRVQAALPPPTATIGKPAAGGARRAGGDGRSRGLPRQPRLHGYAVQRRQLHLDPDPEPAGANDRRRCRERAVGHQVRVDGVRLPQGARLHPGQQRSSSTVCTASCPRIAYR